MDELQELTRTAVRHGQKGFYGPAAIAVNRRILELDPTNVTALLRLARCHEEMRQWHETQNVYERLLRLDIGDASRISAKLEEVARLAAEQAESRRRAAEQNRVDEERRQAEKLRREAKTRAEAEAIEGFLEARTIAIAYRELGDYELALIYHERSVELATSRGDKIGALAAQASTLRRAERPADALVVLEESISIERSKEKNKPTYTSLVATLRELGRLDEARQVGEELVRVFPNDSHALFALGRTLKEMFVRDRQPSLLDEAAMYYTRATAMQRPERNILIELHALVSAGRMVYEMAPKPELQAKLEQFERYVEQLERRLNGAV